jgi:cytochrome c oxidase subunit 2
MLNRPKLRRLLPALLLLGLLALLLSGCETDTPQNTFAAEGEVARDQRFIFYLAMWPALAILILVNVGLLVIVMRFRRRSPDELPVQTHGNTRLEIAWTIAPAILLMILAVPMMAILFDIGRDPDPDAYPVEVHGVQWQWIFRYPEILDEEGEPLATIGEVHFPAGRQVAFHLTSGDVIHSFWIPRLGGKLDVIPGTTNVLWLIADNPGSFAGQCAEFCGLLHADMRLTAHAHSEEDFEAWVAEMTANGGDEDNEGNGAATPTPAPAP